MKIVYSFTKAFCLLISLTLVTLNVHAEQASSMDDEWQFKSTVYLWMSSIKGTVPNGAEVEADFSSILENLDFAFMAGFEANKGDWGLLSDLVYFKVSDGRSYDVGPLNLKADAELESWAINLAGTRKILDNKQHTAYALAGLRYLYIDVGLGLNLFAQTGSRAFALSASDDVIDPIVGIKGEYRFNDNWYLPYRFDMGTGMSDFTANVLTGVGYRYNWGNVIAGYRYLHYDFDSDFGLLKDLDIHGPLLAAQWVF